MERDRVRARMRPDGVETHYEQDRAGEKGADAAYVLQPLAGTESDDVERGREPQHEGAGRHHVVPTAREARVALADDVQRDHRGSRQQVRIVQNVDDPVAPAAEESVALAEATAGPEVDPALGRIACRELGYGQALGNEEQHGRQGPEHE